MNTEDGFELHDKVYVQVSLNMEVPAGIDNIDLKLKIFDVDYTNVNIAPSTEHLIDANGLAGNDNLGHALVIPEEVHFAPGQQVKRPIFNVDAGQPGDNYRVAARPTIKNDINKVTLGDDGQTLKLGAAALAQAYQTERLTIWRTLNVELDSLGPPPAGEPFGGEGIGKDDVAVLDVHPPSLFLITQEYPRAFVEVKTVDAEFDTRDGTSDPMLAPFDHNIEFTEARDVGESVRDVRSHAYFWTIQMFGAYEGPVSRDVDNEGPDDLFTAGYAPPDGDGPCMVYYEVIRDVIATTSSTLNENTAKMRVALHESLHRFSLDHPNPPMSLGTPGGDEGPLDPGNNFATDEFANLRNHLTTLQIKAIQSVSRPE